MVCQRGIVEKLSVGLCNNWSCHELWKNWILADGYIREGSKISRNSRYFLPFHRGCRYLQENLAVVNMLSLNLPKYEKTNGRGIQEYPGKNGDFVTLFYFRSGDLLKQFFFLLKGREKQGRITFKYLWMFLQFVVPPLGKGACHRSLKGLHDERWNALPAKLLTHCFHLTSGRPSCSPDLEGDHSVFSESLQIVGVTSGF